MADEPVRSVAVLGAGLMGLPMARRLLGAGLEVRAWNRTRSKAEPLGPEGAIVADSPRAAAEGADAILTMLADTDAVLAAVDGDDGALSTAGALWIQMSTLGLEGTERCAALAEERGIPFVDAPVLGTKAPAEQGGLVVLGSGPEGEEVRCAPVFEAVGKQTMWLGAAGAGTRLKLVLNTWILSLVEGLAETVALAEGLGVDPRRFLEAIEGGPLDAGYAHIKGSKMIDREFEPSFSARLAGKDARLVLDAAERHEMSLPMLEAIAAQFRRAEELGHGDADMAAVVHASAPAG